MTLQYTLTGDSNGQSLTVIFSDGDVLTVPSGHAKFVQVLGYLVDAPENGGEVDEDRVKELLDLVGAAAAQMTSLSERVTLQGKTLFFDGDPVQGEIGTHIVRLIDENDEAGWSALVNFLEKLSTNPEAESRDSLYKWLEDRDITIHPDGDFIAYKGMASGPNGTLVSVHSGTAFVDNVKVTGQIPNAVGSVITMPRASVETDRAVGCSTGLHAGTWDYANSFGYAGTITVKINPRDVVSVPTDSSNQKLRVSRYLVLDAGVSAPYTGTTFESDVDDDDEPEEYYEDYDYDDDDDNF